METTPGKSQQTATLQDPGNQGKDDEDKEEEKSDSYTPFQEEFAKEGQDQQGGDGNGQASQTGPGTKRVGHNTQVYGSSDDDVRHVVFQVQKVIHSSPSSKDLDVESREKNVETNYHTNLTPTVKESEALLGGDNGDTCNGSSQMFALPRMVEVDSELLGKEEDVAAIKETCYFWEIANQDPTLQLEVEQGDLTMEVEDVQFEPDVLDSQNSVMSTEEDLHCKNAVHQRKWMDQMFLWSKSVQGPRDPALLFL